MTGTLHSDHVNYLILRYLQEAGHENAATAFYREWHRSPEHRDPENFPFAPVVKRNELVSIIQSGLQHDVLEAKVRKNQRRYRFIHANSREDLERLDASSAVLENGTTSGSRPGSSAKRKGRRPSQLMRPPDEFPTPAPKRQRRSEGSEGMLHINGAEPDMMEVDAASAEADADADEDNEPVSPADVSDAEQLEEPPVRYDSMDIGVQTDIATKTSTMYWKVDKPGATILHCEFNPNPDPRNKNALLAVGESVCRLYQVPGDMDDARQVLGIDEPTLPANSIVTASAWHPEGTSVTFAVDSVHDLDNGKQWSEQKVFTHDPQKGRMTEYITPPLLEPLGIVLAIRSNKEGNRFLALRTNLKRGLVLVYNVGEQEPIAWRIFEDQILDAAWEDDRKFVVCGENGLAEHARIVLNRDHGLPIERRVVTTGLERRKLVTSDGDRQLRYDKVRINVGRRGRRPVLASTEGKKLALLPAVSLVPTTSPPEFVDIPGHLTALAVQPPACEDLLAVACEEGTCSLFCYSNWKDESLDDFRSVCTLRMYEGPAFALSWSRDGCYLAVGGMDLVQIWRISDILRRDSKDNVEILAGDAAKPFVTWRPSVEATKAGRNGEHEEEVAPVSEPSLSWSADGESLAFAVGKQIAIIRFRPPLPKDDVEDGETNGNHEV